ncbi:MAG: hypothetical protein EZS28_034857 [Streblomastix strix]|uniref:Uncharacterized protein n=1 Tax=Streblomastix strix TaxID=222440 RepID=A0A5J4UG38_9EUKA|nr:MAG: hypothetical protein EZS28_034857 [Streblomastix strix]
MNQEYSPIEELDHQFVFEKGLEQLYLKKLPELIQLEVTGQHQTGCGYYHCNMCPSPGYLYYDRLYFLYNLFLRNLLFLLFVLDLAI